MGQLSAGFPCAGRWVEIFNSDAYDSCNANGVAVNPQVQATRAAWTHPAPRCTACLRQPASVIPANGVILFARA